ncbi:MAG TPA: hypothetical protein PLO49_07585 [Methanofastidiosum sp.]|nr:hypothetical protein [Methanofastidiosum sp.]
MITEFSRIFMIAYRNNLGYSVCHVYEDLFWDTCQSDHCIVPIENHHPLYSCENHIFKKWIFDREYYSRAMLLEFKRIKGW